MRPWIAPLLLLAGTLGLVGACASSPTVRPPAEAAWSQAAPPPPADPTSGINRSCAKGSECNPGQSCVVFSDNAGEVGLCQIVCTSSKDCPQGFFCGHNAVNSGQDVCYEKPPKTK